MCGVIGMVASSPVNQALFDGLTVLQHRGQDAAGIVTCDRGRLYLRKDNGLVRDVFHTRHMVRLKGNMGIGHVRYPTAGNSSSTAEAQPFYVNSPYGITLAHNGNLTNMEALKEALFREDQRHINTDSDSEVLLNVLAHQLQTRGKLAIEPDDVFDAVAAVHQRCRGAYAAVAMITGFGVIGFRDPHGIRPLVVGCRREGGMDEYIIASESVAVNVLGFEVVRDVQPGEAVVITEDGHLHTRQCAENPELTPCLFEHVYFARPDSFIDGISVYKARLRMGEKLAAKIAREHPEYDIDVVIPIPDTSRTSALELSNHLGLIYREGFIKNRYIGRTFIMPGQTQRKRSVRQKLNAIDLEFRGKNVLLVDDSIVRGTTSKQIVEMARDCGARKVYFASAAPPVRYPNVYGIDMPAVSELIGAGRDEAAIAEAIGADWVVYQDLVDLEETAREGNTGIKRFEASCFCGEYVTGDVTPAYLEELEARRNDGAKQGREMGDDNEVVDLHTSR
ncbi:MAG: amidophosphoribosyltransferase [Thiohalospira sp.]